MNGFYVVTVPANELTTGTNSTKTLRHITVKTLRHLSISLVSGWSRGAQRSRRPTDIAQISKEQKTLSAVAHKPSQTSNAASIGVRTPKLDTFKHHRLLSLGFCGAERDPHIVVATPQSP